MKCQSLFPGKNKKNITNLSSAELAQRVVEVNGSDRTGHYSYTCTLALGR